jgi:hypothetical protein
LSYNSSTGVMSFTAPSAFVSGMIIIWSGSTANIPTGFVLCDGTQNTPDLRNRFVVGAGSNYNPGDTGGADSVTLTTAQLASHSHGDGSLVVDNHTHGVNINTNNNSHTHNHVFPGDDQLGGQGNGRGGWTNRTTGTMPYDARSSTSGNGQIYRTSDNSHTHSHNVNGNTGGSAPGISGSTGGSAPGTNSQGSSATNANLPPYYALCYIMKT